jgi:hypothetical protein
MALLLAACSIVRASRGNLLRGISRDQPGHARFAWREHLPRGRCEMLRAPYAPRRTHRRSGRRATRPPTAHARLAFPEPSSRRSSRRRMGGGREHLRAQPRWEDRGRGVTRRARTRSYSERRGARDDGRWARIVPVPLPAPRDPIRRGRRVPRYTREGNSFRLACDMKLGQLDQRFAKANRRSRQPAASMMARRRSCCVRRQGARGSASGARALYWRPRASTARDEPHPVPATRGAARIVARRPLAGSTGRSP